MYWSCTSSEVYVTHSQFVFLSLLPGTRCPVTWATHLPPPSQPASNNSRSNIVSHALIRKIHTLYQRMLRIYRGNVGLWLDFTTFCYSHGSQRLLSEVISQALQLNPTCAGLWSFAARWEYKRKVWTEDEYIHFILASLWLNDNIFWIFHRAISLQHGTCSCAACETATRAKVWYPSVLAMSRAAGNIKIFSLAHSVVASLFSSRTDVCRCLACSSSSSPWEWTSRREGSGPRGRGRNCFLRCRAFALWWAIFMSLKSELLCSLLLLFPQEGCIDFLPFLVLPSVYRTTTARRPQCFLTHCIPGIFIGDITFHLQLLSMAAEYQVNFSLLNISFASSDTPAFVTFWHYALGFQIWTVPLKWADELKVRFFAVDEVNLESDPLVVLSIHSGKYDVQHDCRSPSSKENWRHFSTQLLSQLSVFQKH